MPMTNRPKARTVKEARLRRRYLIDIVRPEKRQLIVDVEDVAMKLLLVPASKYFGVRCKPDEQLRGIIAIIWRSHLKLRLSSAWVAEYFDVTVADSTAYQTRAQLPLKNAEYLDHAAMRLICEQFDLDPYNMPSPAP